MPRNVLLMDVLDSVLDAFFRLVVGRGDLAPSLRAIAAEAGMSPAGVVHHFDCRERALNLAAARWAEERARDPRWLRSPAHLLRLVPEDSGDVHDVAFDFALFAMGRGHPGIAESMSGFRAARRRHLGQVAPDLDEVGLDLLATVVEGLLFAVSLPVDAMEADRARAVLARLVELQSGEDLTSAS